MQHPRDILLGAQAAAGVLPVCDHYSGVEPRMRKSLQLQAEMSQEFGACVFDVTLDCEDGAPVGGEADHAALVVSLLLAAAPGARVAARVHPIDHPAFEADIATIVGQAGHQLSHLMIPKVESAADVQRVVKALADVGSAAAAALPLHVLIESPLAVHNAFEIAGQPRVQSLSFGLMDFVSSHNGAVPAEAMGSSGQFSHPLVLRASREFGYTRMWSIHPSQIRPILAALAPQADELAFAAELMVAADRAQWAPISFQGKLHDRASYRYFWQLLERGHQTGAILPEAVQGYFLRHAVAG